MVYGSGLIHSRDAGFGSAAPRAAEARDAQRTHGSRCKTETETETVDVSPEKRLVDMLHVLQSFCTVGACSAGRSSVAMFVWHGRGPGGPRPATACRQRMQAAEGCGLQAAMRDRRWRTASQNFAIARRLGRLGSTRGGLVDLVAVQRAAG
jgi:hypothetical protein